MSDKRPTDADEGAPYLALLEELIRHDTTSSRSNLGLIEAIRDRLRAHNVETLLVYDRCRQKANLFATLPAMHGETNGGVVLSGRPTLRTPDGSEQLGPWDIVCFAEGPTGADPQIDLIHRAKIAARRRQIDRHAFDRQQCGLGHSAP